MQISIPIYNKQHKEYVQHLLLYTPCTQDDQSPEICSITLEPVEQNPDTLLGVKIGPSIVPLQRKPTCVAARLSCGHSFNAMSLLVHLAKNSLQCPMCRDGSAQHTLDLAQSFPNEPWVPAIEHSILATNNHHNTPEPIVSVHVSSVDLIDIPVHATIVIYSGSPHDTHRVPTVAMRSRLEIIPQMPFLYANPQDNNMLTSWINALHPTPLHYRLPSVFLRMLQDYIQDMPSVHLHIHVYAAYHGIVFDMAQMQTASYPFTNDFTPVVDPPTERITFHPRYLLQSADNRPSNNNNSSPSLQHFVYEPSRTIVANVLHMLLDLF